VRRVAIDLFQFVGINVLAVRVNDDFLGASHQEQVAVVINFAEVSGVQPTFNERLAGRGFIGVITEHHVWPARNHFAYAARIGVRDLYFDSRQGTANTAR